MLVALIVQLAVVVAAPLLLGRWLADHWKLSWGTFGAGAAAFVASQAVHLPLNAWVLRPLLHHASLATIAVALGLSAGVCEEGARWLVLRLWRTRERSGPHALMFGAGHGGVESMFVGVLAAQAALNVAIIQRIGVENLGLAHEAQEALRKQLAAPAWGPLLGAFERLMTIPFHVSASCLVMLALAKRRPVFLVAAIGWHALSDAVTVVTMQRWGAVSSELWLAATFPVSLTIIFASLAALPRLEPPHAEDRPRASGEPLELVAVEKTFGAVRALDGVTVTIKKGERACLLGPNGAGKTTAIRVVNGALAPSGGWAFLFGASSRDEAFLAAKRRVGVVPQQPGMYHEMTVRQYLEFVASVYGVGGFDALAARLGLTELMDRPSAKLSGGQQRRLSLAAAMLPEPELLILDEPSAGLDPVAAREMVDLLKEVSRDRTTLLCTHDLDEAEELCDNVVILKQGKVLVHDSIAGLRKRSAARLSLRASQGSERLLAALRERGYEPTAVDGAVQISATDGERLAPKLLRELLGAGIDVYDCRLLLPTLEELFLQLVRAPGDEREEKVA